MILDIDRALSGFENGLGITIVLHDWTGALRSDCPPPPPSRGYHRHPFCHTDRQNKADYDRQCLEHCFRKVNQLAGKTREPFIHTCWKGASELVIPLYLGPTHVATLFGGVFRLPQERPTKSRFRPAPYPGWDELPILDDQRREQLSEQLWLIGNGLVHTWLSQTERPTSRRGIALGFLRLNAHRSPSLDELAAELRLSPSRTSHLIRELFGCGFQRLLTTIRLERAKDQLRQTTYTIERIAIGLGFQSAGYLHRIFLREYGLTPGEFRQNHNKSD